MRCTCTHHPDIYRFLDTKRENADEDPHQDALAGRRDPRHHLPSWPSATTTCLFVARTTWAGLHGKPFADVSVTETYHEMVGDKAHPQTKIKAREFLPDPRRAGSVGLPVRHVRGHGEPCQPDRGQDHPLNLCSGDPAVSTPSRFNEGSLVLAHRQGHLLQPGVAQHRQGDGLADLGQTIGSRSAACPPSADQASIDSVPSIKLANERGRAIGLGQMNLRLPRP